MSAAATTRPDDATLARIRALESALPDGRDREFFRRIWATDPEVYEARARAVGFAGLGQVLDAGSGFGQWSAALAGLNRAVLGVDADAERVATARAAARLLGRRNLEFRQGRLEELPLASESCDGAFSYSVLYLTDFRASLRELRRVLRRGAPLYFSTNDLGWYVYNLIDQHNASPHCPSRQIAIEALESSLRYYASGETTPGRGIVMPMELVLDELAGIGFEVVAAGADGSINPAGHRGVRAFYEERRYGLRNVYEVLCRKQ